MTEPRGLPPGRAGRMWVRQRLVTAQRGATLLDRKLRVLRSEQARLRDSSDRAEQDWSRAVAEARRWLLRSAMLGGEREIRLAAVTSPARVDLAWHTVMGVRYPAVERVAMPDAPPRPAGTSALRTAASASATAVEAAARYAAATAAAAAVDAEVTATARRLRAITDRWIPRLESAQAAVGRRLEETERDETARLRWAAGLRGVSTRRKGMTR